MTVPSAYIDSRTLYNPMADGYELITLKASPSITAAGTAEICLPASHPEYGGFVAYKSIITIYRGDELIFRGRPISISDDFYGSRTVTCEGERCFLRDAILEPYLYQAAPAVIFSDIISRYNAQVDAEKQFTVGRVTVTDPNDYIRLESENATAVSDVIDTLVDRVGGYILFSGTTTRTISWVTDLEDVNPSDIDFGGNLLSVARKETNSDLATIIWPYGAKDDTTGERLDISAVNGGLNYIEDATAVALRGRIAKAVYWDDITLAANLLAKAKEYLATAKLIYTSLELSAVDAADAESLRVGCQTRVVSPAHGIDAYFPVYSRTYDMLNSANDTISLGWTVATLTGGSVSGDRESASEISRAKSSIKTDYKISITDAISRLR